MIKFTLNGNGGNYALIDDEFYPIISRYKWYLDLVSGINYAATVVNGKKIRMHQMVLGNKRGFVIDHIDGDGLNNQLKNLRHASRSLNGLNSSKSKGYYYDKVKKKFICRAVVNGAPVNLGRFKEESDAIATMKKFKKEIKSVN